MNKRRQQMHGKTFGNPFAPNDHNRVVRMRKSFRRWLKLSRSIRRAIEAGEMRTND